MLGQSYRALMEKAGAFLELKLCTSDLIEVREMGDLLGSVADQYDDFVKEHYNDQHHEARFYIREIRQGSIIVEFISATIGMMDQVLILRQFLDATKKHLGAILSGDNKSRRVTERRASQFVDMVKAVANAEEGSLSLAFKQKEADGSDAVLIITRNEARTIISTAGALGEKLTALEQVNKAIDDEEKEREGAFRRVLMRVWQHNRDREVAERKRTGHRVIISDFSDKPLPLTYPSEIEAQKMSAILEDEPYARLVFDVTVAPRILEGKLKAYGLIKIHDWFEDESSSLPLIEAD